MKKRSIGIRKRSRRRCHSRTIVADALEQRFVVAQSRECLDSGVHAAAAAAHLFRSTFKPISTGVTAELRTTILNSIQLVAASNRQKCCNCRLHIRQFFKDSVLLSVVQHFCLLVVGHYCCCPSWPSTTSLSSLPSSSSSSFFCSWFRVVLALWQWWWWWSR